jgi:hypothetical protein
MSREKLEHVIQKRMPCSPDTGPAFEAEGD